MATHVQSDLHFQMYKMYNTMSVNTINLSYAVKRMPILQEKYSFKRMWKRSYIRPISFQPKVCYFSALPVPPLTGLSFQKQGLSCERHKRWMGREGGGGGGGGWSSLIIYLRGKEGSQGEQIVFLPEPSPSDPSPAYLKPKPHRISEILIWWHFNILPWWLFSNIYFRRSRALPPEEMKHVKTHYEKIKI